VIILLSECEKVIARGEWVKIVFGRFEGFIGYVLRYDLIDEKYKVMVTKNPQGETARGKVLVDSDDLTLLEIPKDEDDILELIDLALDSGDKDWFMKLSGMMVTINNGK
jgi:hypothetical protein